MSDACAHKNPLAREGTSQDQRTLQALLPDRVRVHELGPRDWLAFAKDYASLINYFALDNATVPADDWDHFFPEKDQIDAVLGAATEGETQPHLALFIAFLKLLDFPQRSLNDIPRRHLEYYYRQVLRLERQPFQPDSVHVLFELAKNASSEQVARDSTLEAGKDADGNPRRYGLDDDLVVNPARVAALKGVFVDATGTLRYATVANSADGLGAELQGDGTWRAFGDPAWPAAPLEVLLAGDILHMQEGERVITVTWTFDRTLNYVGSFRAFFSGEKGWVEVKTPSIGGSANHIWTITVPADAEAIVPYQEAVHLARANTDRPVLRWVFDHPGSYASGRQVRVSGATIKTQVKGVRQLVLNNELGQQAPDKPFMPFGPRPKKNTYLKIECPELAGKTVQSFDLNMSWLNLPANFTNHYSHYQTAIDAQQTAASNNIGYLVGHLDYIGQIETASDGIYQLQIETLQGEALIEPDPMRADFKMQVSSPYQADPIVQEMFKPTQPIVAVTATTPTSSGGVIELRLMESFYHDLYAAVYTAAVISKGAALVESDIPKEPYTPLLDYLTINYVAEASVTFTDGGASSADLQVLQVEPFGTREQKSSASLFPDFPTQQFLVGLEGVAPRDTAALLFQVAEGSENPDHSSFGPGEGVTWSVLDGQDEWIGLGEDEVLLDTSNHFLRPGVVKLSFPAETSEAHYRLDDGLTWVRAELAKPPDAVCRFQGVHAQAARATFADAGNTHEHLEAGLAAGTITQLTRRKSRIKGVAQPYPSFDGKPEERSEAYYRRVSERLRHKDRALAIWDYERLVLQAFPQIYKVKCLNHTRVVGATVEELHPGAVALVVLPRLSDSNTAFRLQPRVSQNTRDEIAAFLASRRGLHVEVGVHNPFYEEVQFDLKVRFLPGKDYNFHRTRLQEDISRLLAPWAYDDSAGISFDHHLYQYDMVNYLENLDYVDFLEDLKMAHRPTGGSWEVKKAISPSNSMAVLVPASSHLISEAEPC